MGFDLYGQRAKSKRGEYFRNNVWWWRPLAEYVLENVSIPEEEAKDWQYNNGTEVSEETALHIADTLDALIESRHTAQYERDYKRRLESLPPERCRVCHGTGKRNDKAVKGKCSACLGKGEVENFDMLYPFNVENVREFAQFCRESGGFRIW